MARRRRRGRFKRSAPDMGWWVSSESGSFIKPSGEAGLQFSTVIQFDDIDSDDSLIKQDKSDWFIKRVLFDFYPAIVRQDSGDTAYRICQVGIGTMEVTNASHLVANPDEVMSPDFYERWRRLFRSYTRPVYSMWQPGIVLANGKLAVDTTNNADVGVRVTPEFGFSHISDDFSVSNAGLVENSSMYIAVSSSDVAPSVGSQWETDDGLTYCAFLRVLLQKRRT